MVAPVTGPINANFTVLGPANSLGFRPNWHTRLKQRYKQRRPYNLPLAYSYEDTLVRKFSSSDPTVYVADSGAPPVNDADQTAAYNKAYSRFVAALKADSADFGTNFAERKQAMEMMTGRLTQLGTFARSLRKLDFGGASRALGLSGRPKGLRANAKSFSNNWLEYHFGWSPLVNDIWNATQLLQSGVPPYKVEASASVRSKSVIRNIVGPGVHLDRLIYENSSKAKIGALVRVTNPNLFLANQLGLVNPVSLAWELVPFSFVVDWFVNVGEFLAGFTDTLGLDIINPFVTRFYEGTAFADFIHLYSGPTFLREDHSVISRVRVTRTPGTIPGPVLRVRNPWRLSPTRGLTAATLLVQLMR